MLKGLTSSSVLGLLLIGVSYYVGAWLGVTQTITPDGIAIIWPPNAVLLSAFLLLPYRQWPLIALIALLAECLADIPAFPLWAAFTFGLVNLLETSLAAWLIRQVTGEAFDFDRLRRGVYFLLCGPLLGSALAALLGAAVYIFLERTDSTYWSLWRLWWFGDALGLMLLTPLIVVMSRWLQHGLPRLQWKKLLELAVMWLLLLSVGVYAFSHGVQDELVFHVTPILLLPFCIWAAMRFGIPGATVTVAIIAALGIGFMVRGIHPYTEDVTSQTAVWLMQEYLAVVAIIASGLAIMLHEIENQKQGLERRVNERTKALAEANKQLQETASTDHLTGIANRRHFYTMAERTLERMSLEKRAFSLLMFDLDNFKTINDQFGHAQGDKLLGAVTKVVNEIIRPMDLFARVGGDEFLILLAGVQQDAARMIAERMRMAVQRIRLEHNGQIIATTVSIGVMEWDGRLSLDALIARADDALYRAKSSGRDSVVLGTA